MDARTQLFVFSRMLGEFLPRMNGIVSGDRDYNAVLGYPVDLGFDDYEAMFRRMDIARAVVVAKPHATWKSPPKLSFRENAKTPPAAQDAFLQEWENLVKKTRAFERFRRADVRAGIGQYAIIVMGFKGRGEWSTPLKRRTNPSGDLEYMVVYDQSKVEIGPLVTDRFSPRYNLPEYYEVDTGDGEFRVHYTRVLHVVEDPQADDLYGTPRLEVVYNNVLALMKVAHGAPEAIWHDMVGTYHADVREGYELSPEDEEALTDAIDSFLNGMRRVIQTQGIDLTKLQPQIIDPTGAYQVQVQLISAATEIPYTVLIGSDRGDVSKRAEQEQWASLIAERRALFAEPLVRSFIELLVDSGALPAVETDEIEITWRPLYEQTEKERAEVAEARGRALRALAGSDVPAEAYVTVNEMRDWLGLTPQPESETQPGQHLALRAALAKITQLLVAAGSSIEAAALVAGFTPDEAAALAAWAGPTVEAP